MPDVNVSRTPAGRGVDPDKQLTATVDKDAFRAMFYMFAGKPDSKHQAFQGKVTVSPDSLIALNDSIQNKFKLHNISESITTASISLDNDQTIDFGTWAEFTTFDWRIAAAVRSVNVRWDFLIKLTAYEQSQRHTLNLSFSSPITPAVMLRVLVEAVNSPQELNPSTVFGGCIARVDFISNTLADELLAIVGRWHAVLPKAPSVGSLFERCERNDRTIASVIRYTSPITFLLVCYFWLHHVAARYLPNAPLTVSAMEGFCLWLLGSVGLLWVVYGLGSFIAKRAYSAITSYGVHHTFRFTTGDAQLETKLAERNSKSATRFAFSLVHAVVLHVIAGLIVFYLVEKR